jgi:hypothetical protein
MLPKDFKLSRYGIDVRFVEVEDVEFVYNLRSNKELMKFISPITGTLEDQKNWLKSYKQREANGQEYYFIFSVKGINYGLERIYHIEEDSYTHGSFVFRPDTPLGIPVLSDIITREIGFDLLGLRTNFFDVRNGNVNVLNYHLRFKPEFLYETEIDKFFKLDKDTFNKHKNIFTKIFNK